LRRNPRENFELPDDDDVGDSDLPYLRSHLNEGGSGAKEQLAAEVGQLSRLTTLQGGHPKKNISEIGRTPINQDSDVAQASSNMKERGTNRRQVVHQRSAKRAPKGANRGAMDLIVEEFVVVDGVAVVIVKPVVVVAAVIVESDVDVVVAVVAVDATASVVVEGENTFVEDLGVGVELVGDGVKTTLNNATGRKLRTRSWAGGKDAEVPKSTANVGRGTAKIVLKRTARARTQSVTQTLKEFSMQVEEDGRVGLAAEGHISPEKSPSEAKSGSMPPRRVNISSSTNGRHRGKKKGAAWGRSLDVKIA